MQINPNDPVSLEIVNKKIEAFVEVVMDKLTLLQQEVILLKKRIRVLEGEKS